jgi:hypothetical protein
MPMATNAVWTEQVFVPVNLYRPFDNFDHTSSIPLIRKCIAAIDNGDSSSLGHGR